MIFIFIKGLRGASEQRRAGEDEEEGRDIRVVNTQRASTKSNNEIKDKDGGGLTNKQINTWEGPDRPMR